MLRYHHPPVRETRGPQRSIRDTVKQGAVAHQGTTRASTSTGVGRRVGFASRRAPTHPAQGDLSAGPTGRRDGAHSCHRTWDPTLGRFALQNLDFLITGDRWRTRWGPAEDRGPPGLTQRRGSMRLWEFGCVV